MEATKCQCPTSVWDTFGKVGAVTTKAEHIHILEPINFSFRYVPSRNASKAVCKDLQKAALFIVATDQKQSKWRNKYIMEHSHNEILYTNED